MGDADLTDSLRALLFLAAAVFFGLGISLPILRFESFFLFSQTPSIIGIVGGLWRDGSLGLAAVLAAFSVLFPILKMSVAFLSVTRRRSVPQWASLLSKWSMMDVLLVALVVFAVKTTGIATASSQPGIWFYGASTILLAIASIKTR